MTEVAFVSRQRLSGRYNGSSTYVIDLARAAQSAGLTTVLIQPAPSLMGRTPIMRLSPDMAVFDRHRVRGVLRVRGWMVSIDPATYVAAARSVFATLARKAGVRGRWTRDRPLPYSVSVRWTNADHSFCRRHLKTADVVLADYIFQSEVFATAKRSSATGIIMHDLFSSRDTSAEAGSGRDAVSSIDASTEARLLARADAVIAIQKAELDWTREHVPNTRAILASLAVATVSAPLPGEANRLLFVGSNTSPNIVGLRWFFDEVWPKIQRGNPEAVLEVVGSVKRSFAAPVKGVSFAGLIDSLETAYARAAVVISPLTVGSGLKIKLVEAMGYGKAIVCTPITLQGVEEQCAKAAMVVATADEFAQSVLTLLERSDLRLDLAARALDTAKAHFSADACYGEFMSWLRSAEPRLREA